MPTKSSAQHRLMEAAAHTPGGYGGVSQAVGKEFVSKDDLPDWLDGYLAWALLQEQPIIIAGDSAKGFKFVAADKALVGPFATEEIARRAAALLANPRPKGVAYDKSARTIDLDGRLHLEACHLTRACVSPYSGKEIPGWEELGLEPDKVYQLLRDPEELKLAVGTFNGIPVLIEHIAVSADDHQPDMVVGATGTNAIFNDPYLDNELVVWAKEAIDGIEDESKRSLSCGYKYRPDMTPGVWNGTPYQGVMREICANHLALVVEGRVPGAIVEDSGMRILHWEQLERAIIALT